MEEQEKQPFGDEGGDSPDRVRESARELKKLLGHWMQATDALHGEWLKAPKRPGFASTQMVLSAMNAAECFDDTMRMLSELEWDGLDGA